MLIFPFHYITNRKGRLPCWSIFFFLENYTTTSEHPKFDPKMIRTISSVFGGLASTSDSHPKMTKNNAGIDLTEFTFYVMNKSLQTKNTGSTLHLPVKKAARCFALPVEATWNLLLIRGVAGAVFVETWPALSFPFVLFLLLPVVSVLRHSVKDKLQFIRN